MKNLIFDRDEFKDLNWNIKDKAIEIKNNEEYEKNKKDALIRMENRRRKNEIREINEKEKTPKKQFKRTTTTKLLMYFIFTNCFMIEVYSMWVMVKLSDLSALYSLIGAVIGESLSFAIYCAKSFNETKEEERIRLERDMFEYGLNSDSDDTCNDDTIVMEGENNDDIN